LTFKKSDASMQAHLKAAQADARPKLLKELASGQ